MTEPPGPPVAAEDLPELDLRKLLRNTIIAILIIMCLVGGLLYFFKEPLKEVSHGFVDALGGFGVALGFFLPDAFTIPLPNDAFTLFGVLGGLGFWECVLWGSVGSLVGGSVGFLIGRGLRRTRFLKRLMATKGREMNDLVRRYGPIAVAVAALTPLPYSLSCWAAGALDMRYGIFILVSLLRPFRVALYLWLLQEGILSI